MLIPLDTVNVKVRSFFLKIKCLIGCFGKEKKPKYGNFNRHKIIDRANLDF